MQWLKMSVERHHASVKTATRCNLNLSCDPSFLIMKFFLIEMRCQEFIFKEQGLFEISENKNPSKIMRYMVHGKAMS